MHRLQYRCNDVLCSQVLLVLKSTTISIAYTKYSCLDHRSLCSYNEAVVLPYADMHSLIACHIENN